MRGKIYVNARFLSQPITGVQRFAIELSLQLKAIMGNNIQFLSPSNILHPKLSEDLDVKVIGKNQGHLWEQIDLPLYLRKNGNPLLLNFANAAPIFYKYKVVTVHDVAFNVFPKTYNKTFLLLYSFLIPNLLKTSLHVLTVSEFSKHEMIKYYKIENNKVTVIFNAVNDDFISKPDIALKSQKYFLAVSSLNYRKNLFAVLRAFEKVSVMRDDIKLYIIGDLETNSFKTLDLDKYMKNKRVKILGRVSDNDLIKYYSNAVGFIYPSFYEGFGIPPLEAQKCKCPVLLSNVSCFPEIFGESVLYCDPYSVQSIQEGIEALLRDETLRVSLIENGVENTKKYSWHRSALKLNEILLKIYENCDSSR